MSQMDLEQDLRDLSTKIAAVDREAAAKKEAAEALVADYKGKGVNPLTDPEAFDAVDAAYKEADTLAQQAAELRETAERGMAWQASKHPAASRNRGGSAPSTLAEALMSSPAWVAAVAANVFEGSGKIEIPGVELLGRDHVASMMKAGIPLRMATLDGSPTIAPDQSYWPPVPIPVRQPRLIDLLTVTTTESNLIQYTKMTTRTDVAAPTAKGTAYPEATYEFELAEAPVRDIGQWVPAHRSELADQGQLQALIEQLLSVGVELAAETEVISGDGTGQHLDGILEEDDINTVTRNLTSERRLEVIHRAITETRLSIFAEPSGIVLHPTDYEETLFEGELGATGLDKGNYLWPAAVTGATPRTMWGLPCVVTTAEPEGTGLVGDFNWATFYVRSGVTTRASDSHADFFIRRMVALLAEMRGALAIKLPSAFCAVEGL